MNHVNHKHGFTLIELMLAMGFVSTLLIAIAMTVIQMGNIYNKGLTLKEVNQAGRSMASDFQKSIAQSKPFDIEVGVGTRYIKQAWGGRLCIGQYSYIWNYGSAIYEADVTSLNVYSDPNSDKMIRFVKVNDPNASYCTISQKKVDYDNAVELLSVGEHNLAIHDFSISSSDSTTDTKTGQQLYSLEFIVGTNDQSALTSASGDMMCIVPGQTGADPAYCSVSRFNIVALAGNTFQ